MDHEVVLAREPLHRFERDLETLARTLVAETHQQRAVGRQAPSGPGRVGRPRRREHALISPDRDDEGPFGRDAKAPAHVLSAHLAVAQAQICRLDAQSIAEPIDPGRLFGRRELVRRPEDGDPGALQAPQQELKRHEAVQLPNRASPERAPDPFDVPVEVHDVERPPRRSADTQAGDVVEVLDRDAKPRKGAVIELAIGVDPRPWPAGDSQRRHDASSTKLGTASGLVTWGIR